MKALTLALLLVAGCGSTTVNEGPALFETGSVDVRLTPSAPGLLFSETQQILDVEGPGVWSVQVSMTLNTPTPGFLPTGDDLVSTWRIETGASLVSFAELDAAGGSAFVVFADELPSMSTVVSDLPASRVTVFARVAYNAVAARPEQIITLAASAATKR